jgi:hypothetical protein
VTSLFSAWIDRSGIRMGLRVGRSSGKGWSVGDALTGSSGGRAWGRGIWRGNTLRSDRSPARSRRLDDIVSSRPRCGPLESGGPIAEAYPGPIVGTAVEVYGNRVWVRSGSSSSLMSPAAWAKDEPGGWLAGEQRETRGLEGCAQVWAEPSENTGGPENCQAWRGIGPPTLTKCIKRPAEDPSRR